MSLRFLIDENIPRSVADILEKQGNDVLINRDTTPGINEAQIIQISQDQQRIIVSRDKDFGFLVFNQKLVPHGVILLRIMIQSKTNIENAIRRLYSEIKIQNIDLRRKFIVFDGIELRVRII